MINSSIVGLVVLVISIAFFYLYLRYLKDIGIPKHIASFKYDISEPVVRSDE